MGKAMWLEYFLTTSCRTPAIGVGGAFFVEVEGDGGALDFAAGGLDVEAGFAPSEVQRQASSSPALRETTSILSATMKAE